jgi:hypothetical protein
MISSANYIAVPCYITELDFELWRFIKVHLENFPVPFMHYGIGGVKEKS